VETNGCVKSALLAARISRDYFFSLAVFFFFLSFDRISYNNFSSCEINPPPKKQKQKTTTTTTTIWLKRDLNPVTSHKLIGSQLAS